MFHLSQADSKSKGSLSPQRKTKVKTFGGDVTDLVGMVMMVVMMVMMMVVMMMVMVMMVVMAEKTAERKCKCISWRMGQLKQDI